MSRERRPLFQEEEFVAEPGQLGCPMLVRGHRANPVSGAAMWRCHLGWALHGELDVAQCAATDAATDCWKVHPERTQLVTLNARRSIEETIEHKASAD